MARCHAVPVDQARLRPPPGAHKCRGELRDFCRWTDTSGDCWGGGTVPRFSPSLSVDLLNATGYHLNGESPHLELGRDEAPWPSLFHLDSDVRRNTEDDRRWSGVGCVGSSLRLICLVETLPICTLDFAAGPQDPLSASEGLSFPGSAVSLMLDACCTRWNLVLSVTWILGALLWSLPGSQSRHKSKLSPGDSSSVAVARESASMDFLVSSHGGQGPRARVVSGPRAGTDGHGTTWDYQRSVESIAVRQACWSAPSG